MQKICGQVCDRSCVGLGMSGAGRLDWGKECLEAVSGEGRQGLSKDHHKGRDG